MEREIRYKINKTRKKVKIETLINQYIQKQIEHLANTCIERKEQIQFVL